MTIFHTDQKNDRSLSLHNLESRTLFSAAGLVAPEMLNAAAGPSPESVQVERMAPPSDNWQASHRQEDFVNEFEAGDNDQPIAGDVDHDGSINFNDINMLMQAVQDGDFDANFDLNGDGIIDSQDLDHLIRRIIGTEYGDTNLDGHIDEVDADTIFSNLFTDKSGWEFGNFNSDGHVSGEDFLLWNAHKFTTTKLATSIQTTTLGTLGGGIPESSSPGDDSVPTTPTTLVEIDSPIADNPSSTPAVAEGFAPEPTTPRFVPQQESPVPMRQVDQLESSEIEPATESIEPVGQETIRRVTEQRFHATHFRDKEERGSAFLPLNKLIETAI